MSPSREEVRIAIFGHGFARTVILPCLKQVDGIRLAGISSPGIAAVRATANEYGIEVAAADHREVLRSARPDLVFVATPPHRHAEMSIDALRAGCHVVCEKPTALNARESEHMLRTAESFPDRIAILDHELRFLPSRQALRAMVADGRLGQILHAHYLLHSPSRRDPALPWNWWSDHEQGGGALGALGSHAVDSLRAVLGEVVEARGVLATLVPSRPDPVTGRALPVTSDDFAAAWLRFASGAIATVEISTVESERVHRLTLAGTLGSARAEEQQGLCVSFRKGAWEAVPLAEDLPSSEELGIPDTDWARAFLRLARATVAAVREGLDGVAGAATFHDGHENQLVLDAIRRSAEEERWVAVQDGTGGLARGSAAE